MSTQMAASAAGDHHTGDHDAHYEEVALSDMIEEDGVYYWECPCGDMFEISTEELERGERVARCPSCTLTLYVLMPDAGPSKTPSDPPKDEGASAE